jgi:hypothetical protein
MIPYQARKIENDGRDRFNHISCWIFKVGRNLGGTLIVIGLHEQLNQLDTFLFSLGLAMVVIYGEKGWFSMDKQKVAEIHANFTTFRVQNLVPCFIRTLLNE